jgi:hypothetical protein
MTLRESATLSLVVAFACGLFTLNAAAEQPVVDPSPAPLQASAGLPPLQAGVAEIKFREFYEMPIGPRGLKLTRKLLELNGKRVRLLGYMAQQEEPPAGVFILAPVPVSMAEVADGPADDLPATAVFVHVQNDRKQSVGHTSGMLLVTGTLEVGPVEERDGRISTARLLLDAPVAAVKSVAK